MKINKCYTDLFKKKMHSRITLNPFLVFHLLHSDLFCVREQLAFNAIFQIVFEFKFSLIVIMKQAKMLALK